MVKNEVGEVTLSDLKTYRKAAGIEQCGTGTRIDRHTDQRGRTGSSEINACLMVN